MTPEQAAAFVTAQAALCNLEVARMQAENEFRTRNGNAIAYADDEFYEVQKRYESVLGYNAVLTLYQEATS